MSDVPLVPRPRPDWLNRADTRRMTDIGLWLKYGVCLCGHPIRDHLTPYLFTNGTVSVTTPETCFGVVHPGRFRPYHDALPRFGSDCTCVRVQVALLVADSRRWHRKATPGEHPFTASLWGLLQEPSPRYLPNPLSPPVCSMPGCGVTDIHSLAVEYADMARSSSVWVCRQHADASSQQAYPAVAMDWFTARG